MKKHTVLMLALALALVCHTALAQLPQQSVSNRVTTDEPMANGGSAMPVGLISDLMVWGNYSDSDIAANAGAVWSFKWNGSNWEQVQKLTPPDAAANMFFGWSLSVDEEIDTGEAWLAVGAHMTNGNEGAVHLYQRNGDNWEFKQTLTTATANSYGFDVDINVDIPIGQEDPQWDLVVGAPSHNFPPNVHNTGTVFVSSLNSLGVWTAGAIPIGAETLAGVNPQYGRSVAIDGDRIIAGAPTLQVDGNNGSGAVIIFTRGEFTPFTGNTPILNPNPVTNELSGAAFGADVDVVKQLVPPRNPTGDYVYLVGAPNPTSVNPNGSVYVLEPGDGSAYQVLPRPENLQGNDRYGTAVKFREDLESGDHRILACSRGPNTGDSGGLYVYDQPALNQLWAATSRLVPAGLDVAPGNSGTVCQNMAAWNQLVAIAVPNLATGSDAVYSNPVILLKDGFEEP